MGGRGSSHSSYKLHLVYATQYSICAITTHTHQIAELVLSRSLERVPSS